MKNLFWFSLLSLSGCVFLTNALEKARCGDGLHEIGVEECDDGNDDELDDCRSDCTLPPECDNGEAEEGEICLSLSENAVGTNGPVLRVADINQDAHLDLIAISIPEVVGQPNSIVIAVGDGLENFVDLPPIPLINEATDLHVGDLDKDGDLDLLIISLGAGINRIGVLLNNGNGTFAAESGQTDIGAGRKCTLGDFNGDSNLDVLINDFASPTFSIVFGVGDGTFNGGEGFGDLLGGSPPFGPFVAGDFDGDGDQDVIAVPKFLFNVGDQFEATFFLNDGNSLFSAATDTIKLNKPDVRDITADDFDGDGDLDLSFVDLQTEEAPFLFNEGLGKFGDPTKQPGANQNDLIVAGDFNKDGKVDIVVASSVDEEDPLILFSDPEIVVEGDFDLDSGLSFQALVVGDFNEDGALDLAGSRSGGTSFFFSAP